MRHKNGFTLIELVVVMAVVAVLAALIIGATVITRRTAKETANRSNVRAVQAGLEAFYSKNRAYPTTSGGTTNIPDYTALIDAASILGMGASALDTTNGCGPTGTTGWEGGGQVSMNYNDGVSTFAYRIKTANYNCNGSIGVGGHVLGPRI